MKQIGVAQKAVVYNQADKILALRRSETAPSWPLAWDLPGGELDFGEDAFASIKREILEETGLQCPDLKLFDVESHVNPKGGFWVTLAYCGQAEAREISLSYEHDQYEWLTPEEFLQRESSPKLKRFVSKLEIKNLILSL